MLGAIIEFAVRRRVVVLLLTGMLLVYGGYALSRAGLDVFPEFSPKAVVIQTEAPGLDSARVELLVSQVIERALAGLTHVRRLKSESIQGLSVVSLVFDEQTDIFRARQWVSERLNGVRNKLPEGVGIPLPLPLSSSSATVLTLGLTSTRVDLTRLRTVADWSLVPRLLSVPGVADVNVFGGAVRQLQIRVVPERLRRFGLDLRDVANAARELTTVRGAGFIENANQRFTIAVAGTSTVEELSSAVLLRKAGMNIKVRDVADVVIGSEPRISAAAVMGEPGVIMMVIGQLGANTLTVSRAVEAVLDDYGPTLRNEGITLHPRLFRPADYIETSVRNIVGHLLMGGVFVLGVLFIFLNRVRPALISALAIPLSLLAAVVTLLHFGINLNVMVLGGLGIALGEVVDDAIIDVENIFRRLRENRLRTDPLPYTDVIINAALEVRGSVVYASFIVAVVFVPLFTLHGVAGHLFAPLGLAYIVAVLASLLVALTVTPALCSWAAWAEGRASASQPLVAWLQQAYGELLRWVCRQPLIGIALGVVCCSAAVLVLPQLGGSFLPPLREGHYIAHTLSVPGTSLDESLRLGSRLSTALSQVEGVRSVSQWAGRAERGADTYGSHYSEYEIALRPASGTEQQRILHELRQVLQTFPGISAEINTFLIERVDETISGYTAPVVVNIYGNSLARLDERAEQVASLMRSLPGVADVQKRSPPGAPEISVRLHPEQLSHWGLQRGAILDTLEIANTGKIVGHAHDGSQSYDIAVVLPSESRRQPADLAALPIHTPDDTLITLGQLASVGQQEGRYNILHLATQRVQTVTCTAEGRDLQAVVAQLKQQLAARMPNESGSLIEVTGAMEERQDAQQRLILYSLLAGLCVLLLVYLAVDNLRHVAIVIVNLPFALVGGVLSAGLTGGELSVGSFVGFVTLFGITVRNSLMLLSHYQHLVMVDGKQWTIDTAVLGAQERLPSILMTALVTALAMLPIALDSDNPGREIMGPMATIIIGGLCTSTILNLLLLPPVLLRYATYGETGK
jgi:CzcA family heavy metal efflux pump